MGPKLFAFFICAYAFAWSHLNFLSASDRNQSQVCYRRSPVCYPSPMCYLHTPEMLVSEHWVWNLIISHKLRDKLFNGLQNLVSPDMMLDANIKLNLSHVHHLTSQVLSRRLLTEILYFIRNLSRGPVSCCISGNSSSFSLWLLRVVSSGIVVFLGVWVSFTAWSCCHWALVFSLSIFTSLDFGLGIYLRVV